MLPGSGEHGRVSTRLPRHKLVATGSSKYEASMESKLLGTSLLIMVVASACASSAPPKAQDPRPEPVTTVSVEATTPIHEPTPEERAKAEQLAKLQQERAAMEAAHKAELARWTPEMRTEVQALANKKNKYGKAAIRAAVANPHRRPANVGRDSQRHPAETLNFLGLAPTMTVLEYGPGEGWYTEILAPVVAAQGKLITTNTDPNGPADARSTFYGQRFKLFLETSPELYGKVETVMIDGKAPKLALDGTVDMVVLFRSLQGMVGAGQLETWLAEFHRALKPGGVLGVEQHRAAKGADAIASAKMGYLPEQWVVEQIEAAGFKLVGKSQINANPKDTKDYPDGVWTLPPSFRLGDTDREKYAAIGESDRMTLKFVKVAKKAAPAAKGSAARSANAPASPSVKVPAEPAVPTAPAATK